MESPSAPEKSSAEGLTPSPLRPPGLEFAMGVALFAATMVVFLVVQAVAFFNGIIARIPEFANASFSFSWFEDPVFQQHMKELGYNGDVVAMEALWSGAVCLVMILVTVGLWKRDQLVDFLGLRLPGVKHFFIWLGVFLVLMLGIEGLAAVFPELETDFMQQVIGSTTNMALLAVAVGVVGPLFEEFLLRGLLYGSLRHIVEEHASVALTAGVFALMHLQYSIPIMLLILPMGVVLGYARARSGSIWVPVLLHMVNNGMSLLLP